MSDHTLICRFQTTPPIPFLKAAITISPTWNIQHLIHKIHHTLINEEPEHSHHSWHHLLQPPNPSHRLVLELDDGCRLPTTESCSIIDKDQLITIRLSANPLLPQSTFPSLLASYHNNPWRNNLLTTHHLPEPTLNLLPAPHHHHQSNYSTEDQSIEHPDDYLFLADTPSPSNHQQQPHLNTTTNYHHPFLPSQDRFTTLPSEENHAPGFDHVDPRLHDAPAPDILSTDPASLLDDYTPRDTTSMFPYRSSSSSSEELKPTAEELDPLAATQHASNPDVARVRSHIAGFRKSAARHYCSSDSDSSFDGNGSSSDSDSSGHFPFSRYAQRPRGKKHLEPTRFSSSRHSLGLPLNRRGAPPRQKRKSAPERFTFAPSDGNNDDQVTRRSRSTFRKSKKVNRAHSAHSSSTANHHHQADNSPTPPPRKHHLLQRVQVVIPFSPDLVSPAYLGRKSSLANPSRRPAKESTISSTQSDRSLDEYTSSSTDSQNVLSRDLQVDSTESNHEPGQQQNSPTTSNSSSPVVSPNRNSQSRGAEKTARSPTKSCSPTKSNLSQSAGRSVRAVYEIHVHDMKFKSASGQGPQRIPCSNTGLNERSTLKQVVERLRLDMNTSWKMIIGDKVWLSDASLLKRARPRPHRRGLLAGLLDGRIVQKDWHLSLRHLGVFPLSNIPSTSDSKPLQIQVIRNWDL